MRSKSKEAIILMAALCGLDNIPSVPKTAWINIPVTVKGKNRPCPCGSGKKYKLCCLGGGREGTQ